MNAITQRHGEIAVTYARSVLDRYLDDGTTPPEPEGTDPLRSQRGAFVTLEEGESLRGCIGRPYPRQSGLEAIRQSAIGAATEDPRFPRVTPAELSNLTVEVSLLERPRPIEASGGDLTDDVQVGRDGLIVEAKGKSGLLLPQVPVDNDWNTTEFLDQTCRKAGLSTDCWRTENVDVSRFGAVVFAERSPGGPIHRADLEEASIG